MKKKLEGETQCTIKLEMDKTFGDVSKECRNMWKKWILLCFRESFSIDKITQEIQKLATPCRIPDRTALAV